MDAEKMRETMETAHDKELEMIDVAAEGAKVKAEEMHAAKMRAFDKAVAAARAATKAAGEKKAALSDAVAAKATGVSETVGAKAGALKTGATKKAQSMPWLAPMAGVVLLLALALSVGKRMRGPASFDI
jgi:hypothetical protein